MLKRTKPLLNLFHRSIASRIFVNNAVDLRISSSFELEWIVLLSESLRIYFGELLDIAAPKCSVLIMIIHWQNIHHQH